MATVLHKIKAWLYENLLLKKKILKITAIMLILAGMVSCGKNNESCPCERDKSVSLVGMAGTGWKLAGIMDTRACVLKELEPKDCEKCYTLVFVTDSVALGYSVMNITNLHLLSKPAMGISTMIYDHDNGDVRLYYDAMETITSFTLTKNELKLCYNAGKNYLLFTKVDKSIEIDLPDGF
jgi:hypothetical protein